MSLDQIIKKIAEGRPDLERAEVRAVATDILYSGEAVEDVLAASSTLDKLISGYKTRQAFASKSVAANDPTTCPICKLPLKPVKLANERKAVFCQKHFVVFPVAPETKGE